MATLSPPPSAHHDGRPRTTTMTSYMSNRSRRSSASNKLELVESPRDKRRLMATSKADPRAALNEAQPAVVAALAETTIEDLRNTQHKDIDGSVITDPDRSNPTRYRLERPLDTIRKWNAAADGTTNRRASYNRPPSFGGDNRRSSSYMGQNGMQSPPPRQRPGYGYYNNRNSSYGMRQDGLPEDGAPQPPYGRHQRQYNQNYQGGDDTSATGHAYQQSYDTMTSGSDEYSKSTNPSSQNSSFDRLHQMQMRKPDEYGNYDHDGQYAQYSGNGNGNGSHYPGAPQHHFNQQQNMGGAPPPPPKANNPRQPIKLNTANSGPPPSQADFDQAMPQKRQSWIKRRFSKKDY